MPAKPPAGVLLMDRPPAPRRVLVTLALAVLLVVAVPASAESIYDETYTESIEATVKTWFTTGSGPERTPNLLYMSKNVVTNNTKQIMTRLPSSYITNYGSLPAEGQNWPVEYKRHDNSRHVGYGEYGYFKLKIGSTDYLQIWATFDELDSEAVSGDTIITINSLGSPIIYPRDCYWDYWTEQKYIWSSISTDTSGYKCAFGSIVGPAYSPDYTLFAGTNYIFISGKWQNRLIIESEQQGVLNQSTITLQRVFSDGAHPSEFHVKYGNTTVSKTASTDQFLTIPEEFYPFSTHVKSISGKWHNETFFADSGGDPGASPVTVYIRNAQTGALLTNAHLTILDSHAGSTPAVDQDLPAGTGTFNLEKADTLRYHASATADGYTLLSPIIFGVPEGGTTIILWMAPDAPPDDPVEEGKSMLYGYAMTQGSQQPISGATVSLDGYGSTTTSSTGFYLFNNIDPGQYTITASAPLHDALTEPVTVETVATQHNLALKGHFLLTVSAKDADDLTTLHNTTISLSDGQESTTNPATFTADYGPYTITAAAGGYYPQTQSAYLDKPGTTTATVLLTARPEPVPPPEYPNYPPHNVKFTVKTLFGTPIPGVTVTAQGIQQTPSTNILERLLGINTTTTPITTELMSGTTDSNGEINFMMIEAVKYRISLYKPDVVNQTLEIYPKEDTYPIIISTAGGPLLPDAGDALRDIHINVTTSTEGDSGHIHIDYNDTTHRTTGLTIQVTQQNTANTSAPEEVIASHTVANDANVTHTFDLSVYKGQSFFVRLEAEHPDFGTVHRDYTVAFKGVRVPLGPLPDGLYIYVAGFSLMLLGGIFGATSATRGVVVIAFAGWLFYAFGWLDDLGLIAPVSLGLVSTIAVMGVIVTRYREEGYQ